jgi:hypothetical protein
MVVGGGDCFSAALEPGARKVRRRHRRSMQHLRGSHVEPLVT